MNEQKLCPGCNNPVNPELKFCTFCGAALEAPVQNVTNEVSNQSEVVENINTESFVESPSAFSEPLTNENSEVVTETVNEPTNLVNEQPKITPQTSFNLFKYVLNVILKPFKTYKENENSFEDIKSGLFLSLILVGLFTVSSTITKIFSVVKVKKTAYENFKLVTKTEMVWDNLKEINLFKEIFLYIIISAGIIAGLAGLYYIITLIMKKNTKFQRLLGISASALVPICIGISIINPIFGLISFWFGLALTIITAIYSIVMLILFMNDYINLSNNDMNIYLHSICISLIILIMGFIIYKVLFAPVVEAANSLNSLFG